MSEELTEGLTKNDLAVELRDLFQDEDARYAYVESTQNSFVAAQIKALREASKMSQEELGKAIGTKQSGVSRLENVNYDSWKVATLRKLARAFHVRLRITFEEFGTLLPEIQKFRANLVPLKFEDDPAFKEQARESQFATIASQYRFGTDVYVDALNKFSTDHAPTLSAALPIMLGASVGGYPTEAHGYPKQADTILLISVSDQVSVSDSVSDIEVQKPALGLIQGGGPRIKRKKREIKRLRIASKGRDAA